MVSALITLLLYIIVLGLLVWLVFYALDSFPLPEPFNRLARFLVVAICVIIVILLLLQVIGGGGLNLPRLT